MFELRPIHKDAIPSALEKADTYRLLNQPQNAESICRDILRVDPDHQAALELMLLSLTDQFGKNLKVAVQHTQELLPRITDEYQRTYYDGVIKERWARSQFDANAPGYVVFDWINQAMECYQAAEKLSPKGNDDPILRWNTCARYVKRHDQIRPLEQDQSIEAGFEDEVPFR
jgi:hypothetical protein